MFLVLVLGAAALTGSRPVTDGDALCYHLQVPQGLLDPPGSFFDPDLHETIYPLVTELLYAIALEFRGPVACRCLHWVLGLVFAANVAALARPSLGRRAWWAASLAILVPAISNGMGAPLNDVSLAAFGAAAIFAWVPRHRPQDAHISGVSGCLFRFGHGSEIPWSGAGRSLVTVHSGLSSARSNMPLPQGDDPRPGVRGRRSWRRQSWWAAAGSSAPCPHRQSGFPVLQGHIRRRGAGRGSGADQTAARRRALGLLSAIVPLTLEPQRFDSFGRSVRPRFPPFPSRSVAGAAAPPRAWSGRPGIRLPDFLHDPAAKHAVPLGTLGRCRWAWLTWPAAGTTAGPSPARPLLVIVMILVLTFETGIALARAGRVAGTVLGSETFPHWLARIEPTFRVGRWVEENLPRTARLIGQDHRGFYIPRDYTMELAHRRRTGLGSSGESSREIVETLKKEGYTHLMLCPPENPGEIEFDPTLSKLLSPWLLSQSPVYKEDLADPDGVVRHYSIYALGDGDQTARSPGPESLKR